MDLHPPSERVVNLSRHTFYEDMRDVMFLMVSLLFTDSDSVLPVHVGNHPEQAVFYQIKEKSCHGRRHGTIRRKNRIVMRKQQGTTSF